MARLRYNLLYTALGAELASAATTVTFATKLTAADGDIPTISGGDYLPLTIGTEIVHLTAYTSEATTGTITREAEAGSGPDATHASGAAVRNTSTVTDFPVPDPTGEDDGRILVVDDDALVYTDAGGGGGDLVPPGLASTGRTIAGALMPLNLSPWTGTLGLQVSLPEGYTYGSLFQIRGGTTSKLTVAVHTGTGGAGDVCHMALLAPADDGFPGVRMHQWTTFDVETSGEKTLTGLSDVIVGGWYWLCWLAPSTNTGGTGLKLYGGAPAANIASRQGLYSRSNVLGMDGSGTATTISSDYTATTISTGGVGWPSMEEGYAPVLYWTP